MTRILGLDLGSNSIGWAVRDTKLEDENQIVHYGVKIFEEGIKLEKGIPSSKAAERTSFRRMRLGYFRKRLRKYRVLRLLIDNDMCPLAMEELNDWLRPNKKSLRKFPDSVEFHNWLKLDFNNDGIIDYVNIYELRAKAVRETDVTKLELGRIFYGMALHRGYKSSRKDEPQEVEENINEKSNTKTEQGIVLSEINKINDLLNGRTLGELFYDDYQLPSEKIRGMHFSREQLIEEYERIIVHTKLSIEMAEEIKKEVFFQRPLKSQKKNVGYCTYEKKKFRCPLSHPLYEEYRMLSFINNIKYTLINEGKGKDIRKPLTESEKSSIIPLFLRSSKASFEFKDIQEKLVGKKEVSKYDFNYKPYVSVAGCPTTAKIINAIGEERWNNLKYFNRDSVVVQENVAIKGEISKEDIWNVLFFFEDKDKLKIWAKDKLDLNEEQAIKFSKIKLVEGYASLSKKALKKIIPYLRNGLIYSHAIFIANLPEVIGNEVFNDNKNEIIKDISNIIENKAIYGKFAYIANSIIENKLKDNPNSFVKLSEAEVFDIKTEIFERIDEIDSLNDNERLTGEQIKLIRDDFDRNVAKNVSTNTLKHLSIPKIETMINDYIKSNYLVNEVDLKKLYHPSAIETFDKPIDDGKGNLSLPEPKNTAIKNPVFNRAMFELRSLINYLLKKDVINQDTRINIEFGREFNSMNQRMAIETWQKNREKENIKFKDDIIKLYKEETGKEISPTDNDIRKYRLWLEQDRNCIYTGKSIAIYQLFDNDIVEIEHTLPRSKTLDNSLVNNTVCFTNYNKHIKKNKIPYELPNYTESKAINGIDYPPIMPYIDRVFGTKIEELDKKFNSAKRNNSFSTKEQKDQAVRRRLMIKFDLDYFKKKYKTFTLKEIPEGFKPSQSTDISLINKYAAEYLRTLFDRVTVYQSAILSEVKRLWNIEPKDRAEHSHHTIDAIALSFLNKKLYDEMAEYYRNKDDNAKANMSRFILNPPFNSFVQWINSVKGSLIVKHTYKDYTLKNTKRILRVNGKIKYLPKYLKDDNGNPILDNNGRKQVIYKLDEQGNVITKKGEPIIEFELDRNGKRIPMFKQGRGYRNALHEQTYYGAIIKDNEIVYVVRKYLTDESTFKSINDLDKIVDKGVKNKVREIVQQRINEGMTFKDAIAKEIFMNEDKGIKVRKVRIKTDIKNPIILKEHLISNDEITLNHKKNYYVQNEGNYLAIVYEAQSKGKSKRDSYIFSYIEMAKIKNMRINSTDFLKTITNIDEIKILYYLKKGDAVLFYEDNPEEIRWYDPNDLTKRLYLVSDISGNNDKRIKFRLHNEARSDKKLKEDLIKALGESFNKTLSTGMSKFELEKLYPRLHLSLSNFNFLVEGKDFMINQDGTIERL